MKNNRLKQITADLNKSTSSDIVGVGYGFKQVNGKTTSDRTIVFTVIRKKPLSEIPENERIPSKIEIDGEIFDTDVIEGNMTTFGYGFHDQSFYDWQINNPGNRNKHRPLMGGVSVTNYTALGNYVGTLGLLAIDNETNTIVGVSNNHVLCDDAFFTTERNLNGSITNLYTPSGHKTTQPNESGNNGINNSIGIVKKYQPIKPIPFNNEVDGALISIDILDEEGVPNVDPNVSWIQFGVNNNTPPRFATTQEIDTILQDPTKEFYSSGRTTGPKGQGSTKLYCTSYSTSITINYKLQGSDVPCYMNDTFILQASGSTTPSGDWSYYPSAGGDSGSAILTQIEGDSGLLEWVIVGLLYGGMQVTDPENPDNTIPIATLCNRIDNVATSLNIREWDGTLNNVFYGNNNNVLTHVVSGPSSDKTKVVNGVRYWQMGLVMESEYPSDSIPSVTPSNTPSVTPSNTPSVTPSNTPSVAETFNVTASGGKYTINNVIQPSLTLVRNKVYHFQVSASGHPFLIKTINTTGIGDTYDQGVDNNGTDKGLIKFEVPIDAPKTLYYQCQFHSIMNGIINIVN
jgi:hypothetical protein